MTDLTGTDLDRAEQHYAALVAEAKEWRQLRDRATFAEARVVVLEAENERLRSRLAEVA